MHAALTSWLFHWPRFRRATHWYEHVNRRTADDVNAGVLSWIRARGSRPYFAFVNYYDAHEFYLPPKPYATMFGPDTARKNGNIGFSMPNGGIAFRTNKEHMKPHEIQAELNAYEAAIAYADASIGALLDSLKTSGALENTIVIVTSDHGEHFGEHGEFDHGATLLPQVLHVPFVISGGRVPAASRIKERVTMRDLPATIEYLAFGTSSFPGTSLHVYWDADSATRSNSPVVATRTIASRQRLPDSVRHGAWATVIGDYLISEFVGGKDLKSEIYDLRSDPLALKPLVPGPAEQTAMDSARALYSGMRWRSREIRQARGR
jgi:arylsulfatase A-like enzyme